MSKLVSTALNAILRQPLDMSATAILFHCCPIVGIMLDDRGLPFAFRRDWRRHTVCDLDRYCLFYLGLASQMESVRWKKAETGS